MGKETRKEAIEDIAAELRLVAQYFKELADRIEAAHADGVVKAIDELMSSEK